MQTKYIIIVVKQYFPPPTHDRTATDFSTITTLLLCLPHRLSTVLLILRMMTLLKADHLECA